MSDLIRYKTSSPSGDLISFLAGIKQTWVETGKKAAIYQRTNVVGVGHAEAIHPYKNEQGEAVQMSETAWKMMQPLLLAQEYISETHEYTGQEVDVDLDTIRMKTFTNQPLGSLNRWFNYAFPGMASDLSVPWLEVYKTGYVRTNRNDCESIVGKIIINHTERYRNHLIHYFFLKQSYESKIIFSGLPHEHERFCKQWQIDVPLLLVDDFYELAMAICGCKVFLGNQSFCFQIAEAMKVPRILEIFPSIPNVIPVGANGFDFYHQGALEYYLQTLTK